MAMYDLPASIDFVLNTTGYKSLPYIGHSQGTLTAFVHLSNTTNSKVMMVTLTLKLINKFNYVLYNPLLYT